MKNYSIIILLLVLFFSLIIFFPIEYKGDSTITGIFLVCLLVCGTYIMNATRINLLNEKNEDKINFNFIALIIVTVIWFYFIIKLINLQMGGNELSALLKIEKDGLALNSWGDFFAGFIAPLGLLWIGYGIYYQMEELSHVKHAFKDQQEILEDQVTQAEILKHHNWFDRNCNELKRQISELNDNGKNTPIKIYNDFIDIRGSNVHKNIYNKLYKISTITSYIDKYFDKYLKDDKFNETIESLIEEYKMLFGEDIHYVKLMLDKVYVLVSASEYDYKGQKPYQEYAEFSYFLDEFKIGEIREFIESREGIDINTKITSAYREISKP